MEDNLFDILNSDNVSLCASESKANDFGSSLLDTSGDIDMGESYNSIFSGNQMAMGNSCDFDAFKYEFDIELDNFLKSDTLDLNESGSDSGVSINADNFMLSPPSSGVISPDPRGDISVDTLDAVSDVSSTSDLGSAYSFDSSPVRPSSQGASIGLDSISDDGCDVKDSQLKNPQYFCVQNTSRLKVKNITVPSNPRPIITQNQSFIPIQNKPKQVASNFKFESSITPKIVSIKQFGNNKFPVLKRLQLDPTKQVNQAILVTRAKSMQLSNGKNKAAFEYSDGKPVMLPMNVNEFLNLHNMHKVKNITIYNPVKKVENNSSVNKPQLITLPQNSIFTKVTEGRTHLKVSPARIDSRITSAFTIKEEVYSSDEETPQQGQRLILSEEEKRLMRKEGITLPTRYPLTKQEERDLKRIRRKIRNKKSAQDSRKRKKEYVDGLEDRVKLCSDENQQLKKRIRSLEKQNENLSLQLKRFQNLIGHNPNNRSHNHASTALMMLILSAALIVVPSLRPQEGKGETELTNNAKMPNSGHSRTLLETDSTSMRFTDNKNLELFEEEDDVEVQSYSGAALSDHDYEPSSKKLRMDPFHTSSLGRLLYGKGDPPDSDDRKGIYGLLDAMLHRLGTNWTDPGGSHRTKTADRPDSSVVVNLNRTLMDDIEVE